MHGETKPKARKSNSLRLGLALSVIVFLAVAASIANLP
jgi:hypothetical protein